MFDEHEYKAAFSKVTASWETRQEVMKMAERTNTKTHTHSRWLVALIATVIALMAVTVTAFAAEEITEWFEKYFTQLNDQRLSEEQVNYIHSTVQTFGQSQTYNGFTLELKSAVSDGCSAYLTVGITAPETITLLNTPPDEYDPNNIFIVLDKSHTPAFSRESKKYYFGHSMIVDDYDGLANTVDMLFYFPTENFNSTDAPFAPDVEWTFRVEGLYAEYCNRDKLQELLQKQEKDENHLILSDEENKECYPTVPLVEDTFEFTFHFNMSHIQEMEFISEPVLVSSISTRSPDGEKTINNVSITSFKLRSLSATILCDYTEGPPDFATNSERAIYAVMKDGSRIALEANYGTSGVQSFIAQSPIILENVDHILLAEGTKLPAPEAG